MFPEHIDVSIYTKAKWVWKKWFALGAGGSEVCGTLHLNVSSCKIGSVGKQLRKAPYYFSVSGQTEVFSHV